MTLGAGIASASNRSGETINAWIDYPERGESNAVRVRAILAAPGRPLGRPETLVDLPADDAFGSRVAVAVADDGTFAIASDVSPPDGEPQLRLHSPVISSSARRSRERRQGRADRDECVR